MNSKAFDDLQSRVEAVSERSTLLSVLDDFQQILKVENSINSAQYCSILRSLLERMKASIFGQLTESEFTSVFAPLMTIKFSLQTLDLLICSLSSIPKDDSYKFAKIINLIEMIMETLLRKILAREESINDKSGEGQGDYNSYFSHVLCSFSDRVYNYLGSESSKNSYFASAIIQKYEAQLLGQIQNIITSSNSINVDLCAQIITDYSLFSLNFAKSLIEWILAQNSLNLNGADLFLNSKVDPQKQEQLIILLVQTIPTASAIKKIFGDSVSHNSIFKRTLVKKMLISRILPSSLIEQRVSYKIACYFSGINPELVNETLLLLLQVFSDQATFVENVNLDQQVQLVMTIIDFAKEVRPEDRARLRHDIMLSLVSVVPEFLHLADLGRKQIGMYLAETMANLFECSENGLRFEYTEHPLLTELQKLADVNQEAAFSETSGCVKVPGPSNETNEKEPELTNKRNIDIRTTMLDSDDDDCIEPEFDEDADDRKKPLYLKECLDSLSEKEKYNNFFAALKALPELIKKKSTGFDDLALEILDRLAFLEDRFQIPEFMNYRKESVKLLLANRPELVSQAIRILLSNQCCMATRYFLLECIYDAAHYLAAETKNENKLSSKPKVEPERILGKVIRRNTTKQIETLKRNQFLDVAPLFVYPLLNLKQTGKHLDLEDKDHNLLAKIVQTLGKLIVLAKYAPSMYRIMSSLFTLLAVVRNNRHTVVTSSCLVCYACIAECAFKGAFTLELEDALEWVSYVAESKKSQMDPELSHAIELALLKIVSTFEE
ncbi:telomere length regulation protein domain-containing protein [Ditylenchus destructor]|uniref:Telomere length regulation protein domain-containing protein n=1 Tax=Ditylenchus destructor TaxID=166010 RepID=A0AAD4R9S5_9BILA|nr:telomere length regulation protein domain-containing protein [Ditylenchus destructor]